MADDIRTRLSEALDENRREIDNREGARVIPLKFRGEWHATDGVLAEALVERDRQLIADHTQSPVFKPAVGDPIVVEHCFWCSFGQWDPVAAPCTEVRRAAAFWLGTQEADR